MNWLRSSGRSPAVAIPVPADAAPDRIEGAAPGVAAILSGVSEDGSHAVIDFGPATDPSLRVYSRYARWIRFADLFGEDWQRQAQPASTGMLEPAVPNPARPYDLVFAWDFLDRLFPDDRACLAEWMADTTAPDARLHILTRASGDVPVQPLRFAVLEVDRIRCEPASAVTLPPTRLVPADMAKLLAPMRIVNAFTLKTGFREYVAVRR